MMLHHSHHLLLLLLKLLLMMLHHSHHLLLLLKLLLRWDPSRHVGWPGCQRAAHPWTQAHAAVLPGPPENEIPQPQPRAVPARALMQPELRMVLPHAAGSLSLLSGHPLSPRLPYLLPLLLQ